ncbi:hypothetical protein DFO70_11688 [Cytobacillus firmus]|uniref:Uncharacterized protein n=2 Tax=Cytobacillus TaxID=2675230 RepID=A0A366JKL7_CYTFI|nr:MULTISPECIES: hypothetical protein [Cytobacillus]RBP88045.1 hypothetical protein DFO70_11688 [Cytobacillus firmus]TDX37777.1 hypothetical protein DFO72_11488 [Cytobacillus oceanisediminis]
MICCIHLYTIQNNTSYTFDRVRGENRHQNDGHERRDRSAKTFRRGRALTFLERMSLKRSALKKQLETPELQSINPILVGELKAIDMVISEFVQLFELYEFEEGETASKTEDKEDLVKDSNEEKKIKRGGENETN